MQGISKSDTNKSRKFWKKGKAVQTGIKQAGGEFILIQDGILNIIPMI